MYFFECIPAGFQTVAMNSITDCFKQLNFLLKCEIMRVHSSKIVYCSSDCSKPKDTFSLRCGFTRKKD